MSQRRVVITGAGFIHALGWEKETCFQAMWDGAVGIDRVRSFDASRFPSQIAGEAPPFKINDFVPKWHRKATKLMSRDIELAVMAANQAVRDAGLKTKGTHPEEAATIEPTRCGVNIGAGLICCDLEELAGAVQNSVEDGAFSYRLWGHSGMESLTPLWLLKYLPNMLNCHISIIHDMQGPSNSITCAEVGGHLAIGESFRTIQSGKADLMVAGGSESKVTAMGFLRQSLLKRISTRYNDRPKEGCRPFDRDADGTVLAEGAGVVILEELEHALSRGANIYGEITGFGASNCFTEDFIHPEADGKGILLAIQKAFGESGLKGNQIDLVFPHGMGIPACDAVEARAIDAALEGNHPLVLATQSRIGNCGAGNGPVDIITGCLAMQQGRVPANRNCEHPADGCPLVLHTEALEKASIQHILSCSYTYGGQTAAVTVSRYPR